MQIIKKIKNILSVETQKRLTKFNIIKDFLIHLRKYLNTITNWCKLKLSFRKHKEKSQISEKSVPVLSEEQHQQLLRRYQQIEFVLVAFQNVWVFFFIFLLPEHGAAIQSFQETSVLYYFTKYKWLFRLWRFIFNMYIYITSFTRLFQSVRFATFFIWILVGHAASYLIDGSLPFRSPSWIFLLTPLLGLLVLVYLKMTKKFKYINHAILIYSSIVLFRSVRYKNILAYFCGCAGDEFFALPLPGKTDLPLQEFYVSLYKLFIKQCTYLPSGFRISIFAIDYNVPFVMDSISFLFIELIFLVFLVVFCYECFSTYRYNPEPATQILIKIHSCIQMHANYLDTLPPQQNIQLFRTTLSKDYILQQLTFEYRLITRLCHSWAWVSQFFDHLDTNIDAKKINLYIKYLLLQWALIIAFITQDLLVFYLAFECSVIPMILMIGLKGYRVRKIRADYLFFIYTFIGSLCMLIALFLIFKYTHSFNYNLLIGLEHSTQISKTELYIIWLTLFIAFALKVPLVPFHSWLPEAHVEASTPNSVILAALLLKLGTYGIFRFLVSCFPLTTAYFQPFVVCLAYISIYYASFIAVRQLDIKRIIAYSSITHMGMCILGLVGGSYEGIQGSITSMISHGYVSAVLFFGIGFLYRRTHSRLLSDYSGLVQTMPIFVIFLTINVCANVSFPGTLAFIAELQIFFGLFKSNLLAAVLALPSIFFVTVFSFKLLNQIAFNNIKKLQETVQPIFYDLTVGELLIFVWLTVYSIRFGLDPQTFTFLLYPIRPIPSP